MPPTGLRPNIDFADLHSARKYTPNRAYAQSKLSNLLFTYELQRRLAAADSFAAALAAHPGGTRGGVSRNPSTPARLSTVCCRARRWARCRHCERPPIPPRWVAIYGPRGFLEVSGLPKLVRSSPASHDRDLQRKLWAVSEELTGVTFPTLPARVSKGE